MGATDPMGQSIIYSDGTKYMLNSWHILDGHKAPMWWNGREYVLGGA